MNQERAAVMWPAYTCNLMMHDSGCSDIAKKENLIIDEHYCFPADFGGKKLENGYCDEKLPNDILHTYGCMTDYEVVLPRFELRKYDFVVFMDID